MEYVTVYTAIESGDAELIASRLESADFNVTVKNEDSAQGMNLMVGGILVQVPEDQAEAARALIAYRDPAVT